MRKQMKLTLNRETLRQIAGPVLGEAVRGGEVIVSPSVSTSVSVKIACTAACATPSQQETCGCSATTGAAHQV